MRAWYIQGLVQNQSFYPYYGSAQKLVYEADAVSSNIYSSTFTPYTSFTLTDTYPPAFMPGYPTAVNINDTTFTLAAAFNEAATVNYVVMPAALVSRCDICTFYPSLQPHFVPVLHGVAAFDAALCFIQSWLQGYHFA